MQETLNVTKVINWGWVGQGRGAWSGETPNEHEGPEGYLQGGCVKQLMGFFGGGEGMFFGSDLGGSGV